jgi:predicted phage tail protein
MNAKASVISLRRTTILLTLHLGLASITACGGGDDEEAGPPAAPEMLEAAVLGDGAHLTWVDASDDEREFMIMRMDVTAGGDYEEVATVPFDTTQHHDAPLTPGTTYMFMVMAVNDAGDSESNEVEFMMP